MKLYIARTAGFCMGVDMALRKLDQALAQTPRNGSIYTLGPIIHNPQVLEYYARRGVNQLTPQTNLGPEDTVVIRAHGIPLHVQKKYTATRVTLLDATCPKVKKAQVLIQRQARLNKHLLLFGEPDHPEVQGLISYARDYTIFESMDELQSLPLSSEKKYFIAAQTAQDRDLFTSLSRYLQEHIDVNMTLVDTICTATKERQDEVRHIANKVQVMVIVGGRTSGNTRRLAQIAQESGVETVHVETTAELPMEQLQHAQHIGLTAGASTPSWIIDDVARCLRTGQKSLQQNHEVEDGQHKHSP